MPKQICFMVMPFETKPSGAKTGPSEIDFDHLWQEGLRPVIEKLGYQAVRADQDWGPVIVKEMLERLVASDLVIADITIPNANVYYEIGVRHAAMNVGCVLIAADWARPVFDIQQMTRIQYPLPSKRVTEDEAARLQEVLAAAIPKAAPQPSPIKSLIPSYPKVDQKILETFRREMEDLSSLQTEIRATRMLSKGEQEGRIKEIVESLLSEAQPSPSAALEVLYLLRDCEKWADLVAFVERLPESLRELEVVREQTALAVSNGGDHARAVAMLCTLIDRFGPTPERLGILGGRYKRLYQATKKRSFLDQAIDAYERGFRLDLNAYYCGSNLPRLLRERGDDGDEERARGVSYVVAEACESARDSGTADLWLNPTWLGVAFDNGDVPLARRCLQNIRKEGHAAWQLESTLEDLERSARHLPDAKIREELLEIHQQMTTLLEEAKA